MLFMKVSKLVRRSFMLKKIICDCSRVSFVLSGALLLAVAGCGSKDKQPSTTREGSPVIAQVNSEAITQADVDFMLERLLNGQSSAQPSDALRQKVLDSLIASRAMKIQMEAMLTTEKKKAIALAAKAYEEELYVKEYLASHVTPEPVTLEMIQDYYDKHPEEFSGQVARDFQVLVLENATDQKARDEFLALVPKLKTTSDWNTAKEQWANTLPLQYQEGRARPGLMEPALEQAINKLNASEISDLVYVNDQIYLVRVTGITPTTPRPLSEVSASIRKQLAAQQLRIAVEKASQEVLTKVDIKTSEVALQ